MNVFSFVFLVAITSTSAVRYDNFTLYRFIPKDLDDVHTLTNLKSSNLKGYDFWTYPNGVGVPVDILVSPEAKESMKEINTIRSMNFEVLRENIQEQIDDEAKSNKAHIRNSKFGITWDSYYRVDQIYEWLQTLSTQYPDIVTVVEGGQSYEGRKILGVKLTFAPGNEKRGVWLDSLIHAREWISGATTTYILNQLLTSRDSNIRKVAESHDWYFFPILNPDGYEHTHINNRLWRKTRKPYLLNLCYGADPNRNWGYKWNKGGSSLFPCDEIYAGPHAFSEIETESLSKYISSIGKNLIAYISFHSYSQMMLLPYGHTTEHLDNYDEVYPIGVKAKQSLAKRYGTRYTVGNIAETIYVATGSSMDWVKSTFHTPIAFTYELRDTGKNGFILPAEEIVPCALETLDSLITILQEADHILQNKTRL